MKEKTLKEIYKKEFIRQWNEGWFFRMAVSVLVLFPAFVLMNNGFWMKILIAIIIVFGIKLQDLRI